MNYFSSTERLLLSDDTMGGRILNTNIIIILLQEDDYFREDIINLDEHNKNDTIYYACMLIKS